MIKVNFMQTKDNVLDLGTKNVMTDVYETHEGKLIVSKCDLKCASMSMRGVEYPVLVPIGYMARPHDVTRRADMGQLANIIHDAIAQR